MRIRVEGSGTVKYRLGVSSPSDTFITKTLPFTAYEDLNSTDARMQLNNTSGSDITVTKRSVVNVSSDFDFDRASSATRINSDGLVQDMQSITDVELVQNGDFEELGSELVTSTSSTDNWINARSNSVLSVVGDTVRATTGTDDTFGISTAITTVIGKTYKINSFGARNNSSGSLIMRVSNTANLSPAIYQDVTTDDLTLTTSAYFVATATTTYIGFLVTIPVPTGEDYVETNLLSVKEVDPNNEWTVTSSDANNYVEFTEGFARLKFLNTSPITMLNSTLVLEANKTYELVVDVHDVTSGAIKIDSGGLSETFNTEGVTTRYLKPTGNTTLSFYRATANVDITLASVSVKDITFSEDVDLARINYDSNGENGHWLLEPTSTNLITYSEDFTNWTKLNGGTGSLPVVTSNTTISPSGEQNADTIFFDKGAASGGGDYSLLRLDYGGADVDGTASIYLKADANVDIEISSDDGSYQTVSVTNTWQRFSVSDATSDRLSMGLRGTVPSNNTATVYAWGGQLEAKSYATSYIPTYGSTVTRATETLTGSGNSTLINSTEGVLYAEIAALADDGTNRTIALNKDTNDRIQMYFNTSTNGLSIFYKAQSGATSFIMNQTLKDATVFNKIAFKWKANDFALWVNSVETDTVSSGVTPTANSLNALEFEMFNDASPFYGKCKALAVFDRALTDQELTDLTSR